MFKKAEDLHFTECNKDCAYFDDRLCDIEYRYLTNCSIPLQEALLERGWRRFGNMHFAPVCKGCNECQTIRIDVNKFKFSKSHKRVFKKNQDTEIYIQKPTVTVDHIKLFNKYHTIMQEKKGWEENNIDVQTYYESYVTGANDFGRELLYFRENKLVAVALIDLLPSGISAIYCYYDHDYEDLSLGKYSILAQISIAKQRNIPYLYLGYWIKDHHSMGYKEFYKPFEVLQNRPTLTQKPIYKEYV